MNDAGFIIGSYVLTIGAVAVYAVTIIRRARRLGRAVPREERPWT
jgi:heme exporter protein CcmD